MFAALSRVGINIIMISTSEIKVSCVVDQKFLELGVRVLHLLLHQGLPHQVAHRLGAIGPGSAPGNQGVETPQQLRLHGDAEADQLLHVRSPRQAAGAEVRIR